MTEVEPTQENDSWIEASVRTMSDEEAKHTAERVYRIYRTVVRHYAAQLSDKGPNLFEMMI